MFSSDIIKHKDIATSDLERIIQLKTCAWKYNYTNQLDWINKNIRENDIHFLLKDDGKDIAYLNLIEIELSVNGNFHKGFGVGNVCSKEQGKGYGKEIMIKTNEYIIQKDVIGLLFCKGNLVDFYKKYKWTLLEQKSMEIDFKEDNDNIKSFIFNFEQKIKEIKYYGRSF